MERCYLRGLHRKESARPVRHRVLLSRLTEITNIRGSANAGTRSRSARVVSLERAGHQHRVRSGRGRIECLEAESASRATAGPGRTEYETERCSASRTV